MLVNALKPASGGLTVIEEERENKRRVIRRRARLLGWPAALSQAAAGVLLRMMCACRKDRIARIILDNGLDPGPDPDVQRYPVTSVNSQETHELLKTLAPKVVLVYGTRVLSKTTLAAAGDAPLINYHAGINPKYRGQHPAYWALASGDRDNAGVTVHLVDEGIDTGGVLYQARTAFTSADTISSYQYVQMASAIPLVERAIADALSGRLKPYRVDLPSRQWFPPTLGQYLKNGLARSVW